MPSVDDNGAPIIFGVSHRDGKTPVPIAFTSDGKILIDTSTTILFDPTFNGGNVTANGKRVAHATSSADNQTVMPWVVNEDTGRLLVSF